MGFACAIRDLFVAGLGRSGVVEGYYVARVLVGRRMRSGAGNLRK